MERGGEVSGREIGKVEGKRLFERDRGQIRGKDDNLHNMVLFFKMIIN